MAEAAPAPQLGPPNTAHAEAVPAPDAAGLRLADPPNASSCPGPPPASPPASHSRSAGCQTDDELLLWLLAGGSTAPSAASDLRSSYRASLSGVLSPRPPTMVGAGEPSCGDGVGAGGRSGGVGKYDSFTSVWSRNAPSSVAPCGALSSGEAEEGGVLQRSTAGAGQPGGEGMQPAAGLVWSVALRRSSAGPGKREVPSDERHRRGVRRSGRYSVDAQPRSGPALALAAPRASTSSATSRPTDTASTPLLEARGLGAEDVGSLGEETAVPRLAHGLAGPHRMLSDHIEPRDGGDRARLPRLDLHRARPPLGFLTPLGAGPLAAAASEGREGEAGGGSAAASARCSTALRRASSCSQLPPGPQATTATSGGLQVRQPAPGARVSPSGSDRGSPGAARPPPPRPSGSPLAASGAGSGAPGGGQVLAVVDLLAEVYAGAALDASGGGAGAGSDGLSGPGSGAVRLTAGDDARSVRSELSFEAQVGGAWAGRGEQAGGRTATSGTTSSSQRWSHASAASSATLGWAAGLQHSPALGAAAAPRAAGPAASPELAAAGGPAAAALDGGYGARGPGVLKRCRSAEQLTAPGVSGEERARCGGSNTEGGLRACQPDPPLTHQEHRRAALLQAWQAFLAESTVGGGGQAHWRSPDPTFGASAPRASALAPRTSASSVEQLHWGNGVGRSASPGAGVGAGLGVGVDVEAVVVAGPCGEDGAGGLAQGADWGHSPRCASGNGTSPSAAAPAGVPGQPQCLSRTAPAGPWRPARGDSTHRVPAYGSGDGSGAASAGPAAPAAGDERTVRLSKSLSERSLLRAAGTQYRRVARTKSRFALLQQEASDSSEGACGGRRGSVPRNSSGGSLGSRTALEGVAEEAEEDVAEGASAAALTVAGSSGGGSGAPRGSRRASLSSSRTSRSRAPAAPLQPQTPAVECGDVEPTAAGEALLAEVAELPPSSSLAERSRGDAAGIPGLGPRGYTIDGAQPPLPSAVPRALRRGTSADGRGARRPEARGSRRSGASPGGTPPRGASASGVGAPPSRGLARLLAAGGVPRAASAAQLAGGEAAGAAWAGGASASSPPRRSAGRSASELSFAGGMRTPRRSLATASPGGPSRRESSAGGGRRPFESLDGAGGGVPEGLAEGLAEADHSAAGRAAASIGSTPSQEGNSAARTSVGSSLSAGSPLRPPVWAAAGPGLAVRPAPAGSSRGGGGGDEPAVNGPSANGGGAPSLKGISNVGGGNSCCAMASVSSVRGLVEGAGEGGRQTSGAEVASSAGAEMPSIAAGFSASMTGRRRTSGGGGGGAGGSANGSRGGSVCGEEGGDEAGSSDSDAELLEALAGAPAVARLDPLKRVRSRVGPGAPGKTPSFRFAAPIVPPSPLPAAAAAAAPAPAPAPAHGPPSPFVAPPEACGLHDSPLDAGAGAAEDEDDIPVPPLAAPVVPEPQRHPDPAHHPGASPAPLSAVNLHHHTRHWESAAPPGANSLALAMALASPSPSQSGPLDPLGESESGGAAPLAGAAATQAGAGPGAGGAEGQALELIGAGGGVGLGVGGGCAPGGPQDAAASRALVAPRLAVPVMPYSGAGDAAAAVVAAATAGLGLAGPTAARGISRQPSTTTTAGGLSVGGSSANHSEALAHDDPAVAAAAAAAAAAMTANAEAAAAAAVGSGSTRSGLSALPSPSPSVLAAAAGWAGAGASTAGPARSVVLRVNSGGAAFSAGGGGMGGRGGARAQSKLGGPAGGGRGMGGGGGDSVEAEVEEAVLANRRLQDERAVLLDEVVIDRVLGFGSMGMVYHGRLYDTKVVVKLIEHGTGVLGKEKERGRLARVEACVSRLLLHPNIVTTYDACTGALQPGRLAAKLGRGGGGLGGSSSRGGRQRWMTVMVQELCELGTLRDAISKRRHGLTGPSPEALPLRVALDIAHGMKHMAALRVIHADLKAENVLLSRVEPSAERPHGFVAKIADFGLAMVLAPGEDELRQGIHGTVSHMPPEAMRDTVFSLATDVFSFGVVLWELHTGESPYRGMAPHEVVEAVCAGGERPPWPEGSPPELVSLACDCWHTDPHSRPSFGDVVERLRQLLAPAHGPPERSGSMLSGMTEESDELEAALRQQRRGAPAPTVRGSRPGGPGTAVPSETGSDLAAAVRVGGMTTLDSGAALLGGEAGVPREAPRDPLGLLLWALCQLPAEPLLRVPGPCPDSEQWVLQVQDMVLASRDAGAGAAPSVRVEELGT